MAVTNLGAYLIIASYNRGKWKDLSREQRVEARERAKQVFPREQNLKREAKGALAPSSVLPAEDGIGLPEMGTLSIPGVLGVQMMRSFHSGIHQRVPDNFSVETEERQEEILEAIFEDFRKGHISAPGVEDDPDPGIGWVAIVDAPKFDEFVQHMGGRQESLWNMYTITVIPLNADRTTKDVYDFMTPVHWNKV